MIPVLSDDDTVHYREVKVGDNDGQMVSILDGLKEGERVALNVGSNLTDGSHVRPKPQKEKLAVAQSKTAGAERPAVSDKPAANAKPVANDKPVADDRPIVSDKPAGGQGKAN